MTDKAHKHISEAKQILISLGLPRAQQNERSALCLLALLNLTPEKPWPEAEAPLMGITPIMDWASVHYRKQYAPNTRETFRRHSMHQFVDAGIALYNPDLPERPVNSPKAVYQIAPGSALIYAGDTGDKWGYFDAVLLFDLGVSLDLHGKMPDVVLYDAKRNWLLLVESVTSHGPMNSKRHAELEQLFTGAKVGIVYVTAFPNRTVMARYLGEIAWETEVWVADTPSHLIHFDGERFLGPYHT